MTPRNSRGVFLFPDQTMGIAEVRKPRSRKDRPVPALEFRARQIAIARQVIEPGCTGPEFEQPSGLGPAEMRNVAGNRAQGPEHMNPARRRRPCGDVVSQYRHAAWADEPTQMQ